MSASESSRSHRAAVLAVGTELTTGQVTNRNAGWIATQLEPLGVETVVQLCVPDDRALILKALQFCAEHAELVFVTGGLGPTTDDFTREVIAQFLNAPLQFSEESWQKIETRLTQLKIPLAQSNRQQCYFPKGTRRLPNSEGTADGFFWSSTPSAHAPLKLWVLPGPPREIAALFRAEQDGGGGIAAQLKSLFPEPDPKILYTWQCLGGSESLLGEKVESALFGSSSDENPLQLEVGYRAHRPFVEIKVWIRKSVLESKAAEFLAVTSRLEATLQPWLFSKGEPTHAPEEAELLLASILNSLKSQPHHTARVRWVEPFPSVALQNRLSAPLANYCSRVGIREETGPLQFEWVHGTSPMPFSGHAYTLEFGFFPPTVQDPTRSRVWINLNGVTSESWIESPYSPRLLDRSLSFCLEKSLRWWRTQIESLLAPEGRQGS